VRSSERALPRWASRLARDGDERSGAHGLLADIRGRLFRDRWSVLLGQIALHSFIVVMLSGVFLMFFYDPSTKQVTYHGSYLPLTGTQMSRALASTMAISFEIRGGLLIRQVHHWGTLVMVAVMMLHLLRLFFTGAFRRPRRVNWVIAVLILVVMMAAGFTGAVLPDDMLSGTSLVIFDGAVRSTPVIGTWLSFLLFGGSFPGHIITLSYVLHAFVLPTVLLSLFIVNRRLARTRSAARHAPPGHTAGNVRHGLPAFAVTSSGLFLVVTGILVLMAATLTINPIWLYGPADPANASAGAGPEWYLAFLDGALRLVPPDWEFVWLGKTWTPAVLLPVIAGSAFFVIVAAYPYLEAWITADRGNHHDLERPRNNPARTGIGVAGMTYYGVLWAAASADTIAVRFHLTIETVLHGFQVLIILGPIIGFVITRRLCVALQHNEREVMHHGIETGIIIRSPDGGYTEIHRHLDADDRRRRQAGLHEHPTPIPQRDVHGQVTLLERQRTRLARFLVADRQSAAEHSGLVKKKSRPGPMPDRHISGSGPQPPTRPRAGT